MALTLNVPEMISGKVELNNTNTQAGPVWRKSFLFMLYRYSDFIFATSQKIFLDLVHLLKSSCINFTHYSVFAGLQKSVVKPSVMSSCIVGNVSASFKNTVRLIMKTNE